MKSNELVSGGSLPPGDGILAGEFTSIKNASPSSDVLVGAEIRRVLDACTTEKLVATSGGISEVLSSPSSSARNS